MGRVAPSWGGLAQWGKWVINSFFCIFMYFLNKTLCQAKGLGVIMWGEQGHPVPPPQGANPCKDTKCTGGVVAPCHLLMFPQSWCPPPPPLSRHPPCPGVPGTVRGVPAGWVPIRSRSRRSWWGGWTDGGWIQSGGWGGIKNKTDRCVMGEVGARLPFVPPSTQHPPVGRDGGVGVGGQEPPQPRWVNGEN